MTLAWPWGLGGLLALPVIWWLHRRASRPQPRSVASLLFFSDLEGERAVRRARRFDPVLFATLLGAAALAFAASGPALVGAAPQPRARIVVEAGPLAAVRGYERAVDRTIAEVRSELSDDAAIVRIEIDDAGRRPGLVHLDAVARADDAMARHVVARAAPASPGPGVRWWPIDLDAGGALDNAGIVAVGVIENEDGSLVVQATVERAPGEGALVEARVSLRDGDGNVLAERVAPLAAGGAAGFALHTSALADGEDLAIVLTSGLDDALAADDTVRLVRTRIPLFVASAVDSRTADAVRAAAAAAGRARFVANVAEARLVVGAEAAAGDTMALRIAGDDSLDLEEVPASAVRVRTGSSIAKDLGPSIGSVRLSRAMVEAVRHDVMLLGWRDGERTLPLLVRRDRVVTLTAPLGAGRPPLATTPLLPLLLDNLLDLLGGPEVGAGWRAEGLLDATTTRLGDAFDRPRGTTGGAASSPERPLRPLDRPAITMAVLALLAAWLGTHLARLAPRRRARSPRPT